MSNYYHAYAITTSRVLRILQAIEKPIEQPEFYGWPVDIRGVVDGKAWNLWRY